MNWPFITRTRHEQELAVQQRGYGLMLQQIDERHTVLRARITEAETVIACLEGQVSAEKARADHLQQRYDDAVGLGSGRIADSRSWQPGYVEPKPDPKPGVAS